MSRKCTRWALILGLVCQADLAVAAENAKPAVDCKPTYAAYQNNDSSMRAEILNAGQQSPARETRRDRAREPRARTVKPCIYLASN